MTNKQMAEVPFLIGTNRRDLAFWASLCYGLSSVRHCGKPFSSLNSVNKPPM